MELKDESDSPVSEVGKADVVHPGYVFSAHQYRSSTGSVQGTEQMEQRGLACAAASNHGHGFAGSDPQVYPLQNPEFGPVSP